MGRGKSARPRPTHARRRATGRRRSGSSTRCSTRSISRASPTSAAATARTSCYASASDERVPASLPMSALRFRFPRSARRLVTLVIVGAAMHALTAVAGAAVPTVTAVELAPSAPVPEARVRGAIGELAGKPLSRDAVRASLERLWGLGLFSAIRVEEVPGPGGVALRFELTARPLIRRIRWEGHSGIDVAEMAGVAGLATGEEASESRLERARRDLLARYRREGFFAAQVDLRSDTVGDTAERDVTVTLEAGRRASFGEVRLSGEMGLPAREVSKVLGLRTGDSYRDLLVRDRTRALEERLRRDGFFEARVTASAPEWRRATNRVDLEIRVAAGPAYRVEFDGRSSLPVSALRSRLTFAASGVADQFEQQASAREIEALYRESGHPFARAGVEDSRQDDVRVITFHIQEGPRVTVESVTFTGNHAVSSERLAKTIEPGPLRLLRPEPFRQDTVDRDVRTLLAFLRDQGYADATVGPAQVTFTDDRR